MKNIFAVLGTAQPNVIAEQIRAKFPDDSFEVQRGQWLVSAEGTSQQLCEHLGVITRSPEGAIQKGPTGSALVVAVSGYYGIQSANLWEWVKAHWETK